MNHSAYKPPTLRPQPHCDDPENQVREDRPLGSCTWRSVSCAMIEDQALRGSSAIVPYPIAEEWTPPGLLQETLHRTVR